MYDPMSNRPNIKSSEFNNIKYMIKQGKSQIEPFKTCAREKHKIIKLLNKYLSASSNNNHSIRKSINK